MVRPLAISAETPSNARVSDAIAIPSVFANASIPGIVFSFAGMLGMCLVGRVFYALRSFNVDPDLWWHIKYAQGILSTHHWPTTAQYSFTLVGQHFLSSDSLRYLLLATTHQ